MDNPREVCTEFNINPDNKSAVDEASKKCENEERSPRYWYDCHQLLSLLPKEVWNYIGTSLDNQDIINLTNSSLFFRDLFLKKRIFHLFSPILDILLPKLKSYMDDSSDNYHEDVRGVLLECRHTCKSWNRIIDQKACILKPGEPKSKNLVRYILSKNYTFQESTEIDKFLEYFQISHPPSLNPSPAKCIDFHVRLMEQDYPELILKISTLLNKYGVNIQSFGVTIMFGLNGAMGIREKFVEWLDCMPNLQKLNIFTFIPLRFGDLEHVPLEILPPRNLNNLKMLSVETFIPPLENERIPVEWSWLDCYNFSKVVYQNYSLNFLEITIFNKLDVKILEMVKAPLKTLVVQYYCKEDEINLCEVFNMLGDKFAETLENLRITFRVNNRPSAHMKVIRDCFNGRLNLPKIRKFEINILRVYFLDFLLGMKDSLEELIINCCVIRTYDGDFSEVDGAEIGLMESNQIVEFLAYQDKILESNIWNVFLKLKTITLGGSDYRREFRREDWKKIQHRD